MIDPRDYEIRIWYSAAKGDECYVAQVLELPGVMAHGHSREEAAREIQIALEGVIEWALTTNTVLPEPQRLKADAVA
jgi:predicted RNase H-like HicB family nuclease